MSLQTSRTEALHRVSNRIEQHGRSLVRRSSSCVVCLDCRHVVIASFQQLSISETAILALTIIKECCVVFQIVVFFSNLRTTMSYQAARTFSFEYLKFPEHSSSNEATLGTPVRFALHGLFDILCSVALGRHSRIFRTICSSCFKS